MRVAALFLFALSLLAGAHAQEQASSYPHKAIRLIVPFPPGGTTDIVARLLAQGVMADKAFSRGRAVFIDNRSGAEGMIGVQLGARAAPDGYTLTVSNNQTHAINAMCRACWRFRCASSAGERQAMSRSALGR